jgi:hypothetical protein
VEEMTAERVYSGQLVEKVTVANIVVRRGTLVTVKNMGKSFYVTVLDARYKGLTFLLSGRDKNAVRIL